MAMNQVQFRRDLSIAEFMQFFGSDAASEATRIQSRWPQGFICPASRLALNTPAPHSRRLHDKPAFA